MKKYWNIIYMMLMGNILCAPQLSLDEEMELSARPDPENQLREHNRSPSEILDTGYQESILASGSSSSRDIVPQPERRINLQNIRLDGNMDASAALYELVYNYRMGTEPENRNLNTVEELLRRTKHSGRFLDQASIGALIHDKACVFCLIAGLPMHTNKDTSEFPDDYYCDLQKMFAEIIAPEDMGAMKQILALFNKASSPELKMSREEYIEARNKLSEFNKRFGLSEKFIPNSDLILCIAKNLDAFDSETLKNLFEDLKAQSSENFEYNRETMSHLRKIYAHALRNIPDFAEYVENIKKKAQETNKSQFLQFLNDLQIEPLDNKELAQKRFRSACDVLIGRKNSFGLDDKKIQETELTDLSPNEWVNGQTFIITEILGDYSRYPGSGLSQEQLKAKRLIDSIMGQMTQEDIHLFKRANQLIKELKDKSPMSDLDVNEKVKELMGMSSRIGISRYQILLNSALQLELNKISDPISYLDESDFHEIGNRLATLGTCNVIFLRTILYILSITPENMLKIIEDKILNGDFRTFIIRLWRALRKTIPNQLQLKQSKQFVFMSNLVAEIDKKYPGSEKCNLSRIDEYNKVAAQIKELS